MILHSLEEVWDKPFPALGPPSRNSLRRLLENRLMKEKRPAVGKRWPTEVVGVRAEEMAAATYAGSDQTSSLTRCSAVSVSLVSDPVWIPL